MSSLLHTGSVSDTGRIRAHNEDAILCDEDRGVFAVIDGLGGEAAGEVAARIAKEQIQSRLRNPQGSPEERLREAIALANQRILEHVDQNPELARMACVATVAFLEGETLHVAHVGDSRLYLLREGTITKLTRDHSPVGVMEDEGHITELEAMAHPNRNEIYRDIGSEPRHPNDSDFIDYDMFLSGPKDALLLCTDGLTDLVASHEIQDVVLDNASRPQTAVKRLVDLANERGGKDNVSVVLVVREGFENVVSVEDLSEVKTEPTPGDEFETRPMRETHATANPSQPKPTFGAPSHDLRPLRSWDRASSKTPWVVTLLAVALLAGGWFFRDRMPPLFDAVTPPQTLIVGEGHLQSIGEAMRQAKPGDTVELLPGEYKEILIMKDGVHLRSRVPQAAVLARPDSLPVGLSTGILVKDVSSGTIEGLALGSGGSPGFNVGIHLENAAVTVFDVEVTGTDFAAIQIYGEDASTIRSSYLHDNLGRGVLIDGLATTVLERNRILANGVEALLPGIEILGSAAPTLTENLVESSTTEALWIQNAAQWEEYESQNQLKAGPEKELIRVLSAASSDDSGDDP
ncbi:MAG: SpoIIE family protein phosphatase [Candidatus Eisenbacteria bacterium]|uniref:SpoIIE family protein phosphatase n=1 Tax=Eiseniibacteriota bacterium TaxID=2212470 RepID=A0A7Y2EA75_UNCEI|nr:SpoIIE family protein phosphatase [Candidatus Eisenbacteria bacterium]